MRKNNNVKKFALVAIALFIAIASVVTLQGRASALEAPAAIDNVAVNETVTESTTASAPTETEAATEATEVVVTDESVTDAPAEDPVDKPEDVLPETDVPAHTHNYSKKTTKATCTSEGCTTYTCSCGDSYVADKVAPIGHNYESVVTAPAIGAVGYTTHTCKNCGDEYVDSYTDALVPETEPVETEPAPIEPAPTEPVHVHNYVAVQTVKPNCTTEGYTVYKCECGDAYNADFTAKTAHNYNETVVEPTTEKEGYTVHTCTGCGDTYKDNFTPVVVPETEPSEPDDEETEVTEPTQPEPTEPEEDEEDEEEEEECVHHCDPSDGHEHEEIQVGCYIYVYCIHVKSPMKGADGFTVYYPWSFY